MASRLRGSEPLRVATRALGPVIEIQLDVPAEMHFDRAEVQRALLLSRAMVEPLGARLALDQAGPALLHIKLAWPAESGS
jgi:hypothetical protein